MINIEINNNKVRLSGNMKVMNKVYEELKVKHPNAWHLRQYMPNGWDGCFKYLSEAGYAKTGLFPLITRLLDEYLEPYTILDRRKELEVKEIPTFKGFEKRDYQIEAVENVIGNEVGGVQFVRGIIGAATNAGKTIIAAMIHGSIVGAKTLILMNSSELYKQFLGDMPNMFGDDWGYMQGKNVKWANIMVVMTPTLIRRLTEYKVKLAGYNTMIFDECHLITSKTNKKVITALYNTSVRVGLSGTAFKHKDRTKNMDVRAFFGDEVYTISNLELMDQGYSTPIVVKIIKGNTKIKIPGDYEEEYRQGITDSRERTRASMARSEFYLERGVYPILIVGRYHDHVENLYAAYQARFGNRYKVAFIHHKVKDRTEILDKFKRGEIDILISSLIIKLGQNMPLIRYMQNAEGGDSHINALQLLGRAIRAHTSKNKVYYEDFYDVGRYLMRHGKHRIKYYKQEGFKVIELWKKK